MSEFAALREQIEALYARYEPHRHACEVQSILERSNGDGARVREILAGIEKRRGKAAAARLRADLREAWAKKRPAT